MQYLVEIKNPKYLQIEGFYFLTRFKINSEKLPEIEIAHLTF